VLAKLQAADLAPMHLVGAVSEAQSPRVRPHGGEREFLAHLALAANAVAPCAFDAVSFPTRPTCTADPWFLPGVGSYYRLRN
jgi:hypothetical protein